VTGWMKRDSLRRARRAAGRLRRQFGPVGCPFHGRGRASFNRLLVPAGLPSLQDRIAERLRDRPRVRLLEIGCGEGRLLLDLHGVNASDWPVLGRAGSLPRVNAHYRAMLPERLRSLPLPRIHAADAQDLSGFPHRDFGFVGR